MSVITQAKKPGLTGGQTKVKGRQIRDCKTLNIYPISADKEEGVICHILDHIWMRVINRMKKNLFVAAFFVFLCASVSAQSPFRIFVEVNGGNLTIIRSEGTTKELIIPERINDMPVTIIGEGAFTGKGLTLVTIPDSVVEIADAAFSWNELGTLVIGNNVETIGQSAFANNKIKDLTIGAGVTTIGMGAFMNNELEALAIPDSVTSIGAYAFFYNRLRDLTIPDTVVDIGEGAFSTNRIYRVTIGSSVEAIGDGAFYNNQLTSISIPASLRDLGERVFESRLTSRGGTAQVDYMYEDGEVIFSTANNFDTYYATTGKRAGTYTYSRDGWAYEE
jgi:hypothetical protein